MFGNKKTGLVLGGGGARGFFHMGVIKGIQQLGIKIDEISGTSIGAVVGLIYAARPETDFEKLSQNLDFFKLIQAMVKGGKVDVGIESFLKSYIGVSEFEELKIKMSFNATDINNYREIVFEKGKIFPGLLASIAIPGVFAPLKYENDFLVDGGVINNIPINLIKNCKRILVSDISGPIKKIDEKTTPGEVLFSSVVLMQRSNSLQQAKIADKKMVYLMLDDDKTFILDFRKKNYQYLIDLGYKAVMERRELII